MKTVDLIRKKRDGSPLTREEIEYLIGGYVRGEIPDYQVSALLMAIFFRGMDDEETATLTDVMAHSGTLLDLSKLSGFPVDKHSTGGVGDKTTLVLIPLLAAAGLVVAKLSGRALGHTGGTIDKLESIPGFRTDLSREEFLRLVGRSGLALADHTADMVPADRLLYELRDVTSTVDSLPLIVASIMSKKIAGGARGIVIDVKTGSGAFLPKLEDSRRLARSLVSIGVRLGRKMSALITDMSQPLGHRVGNALEVREAIETLRGKVRRTSRRCAANSEPSSSSSRGRRPIARAAVSSPPRPAARRTGALAKFQEMVREPGRKPGRRGRPSLLPTAARTIRSRLRAPGPWRRSMPSPWAGRRTSSAPVASSRRTGSIRRSGWRSCARSGERVEKGDPLAILHVNDETNLAQAKALVERAFTIGEGPIAPPP